MKFSFSDEQEQFREFVRKFMETNSPTSEVRRIMDTEDGYDKDVWQSLSESLGLPGLHIPEQYGGQGFGPVELCIALEEMGRSLFCAPYFGSSVLATTAIIYAGSDSEKDSLLPDLATGEQLAAFACAEPGGHWESSGISMVATDSGGKFHLNGRKSFVVDGLIADLIIVVARLPDTSGDEGITFFTVKPDAAGLDKQRLDTIDATRKLSVIDFKNVEAELLGESGNSGEALKKILDLSYIALTSEMVGGAQKLFENALDYTKMRVQFGRTIGSFQSIKHKCADLLIDVEMAKSAAYYAAEAAADDSDDLSAIASLAKACASDTYTNVAANTIQLHGGIGFTWENDTHLYFKRAKSSEVFLGGPEMHRERLIQHWNDQI